MKGKAVLSHPRDNVMFAYFLVTFISGIVVGFVLLSPFLPSSVIDSPVQGISPPEQIPSILGSTHADLSFQTPMLYSNTTYYGNVMLCCVFKEPETTGGMLYFSSPVLYIFSDSDYSTRSTSNAVASINGETYSNYTLNGTTGTEILSIQFTPQGSGVYHFVVDPSNGECSEECNVTLHLNCYKTETVEDRLPFPLEPILGVLSVLGLILGPLLTRRSQVMRDDS
jgi:hypothetical protein